MPKRSLVGLVIAGLALTYAPAYASNAGPVYASLQSAGSGPLCQFASTVDPTAEEGTQSGQLSGGPVLFTEQSTDPDRSGTTPDTGTLTCRIQVNQGDHNGSGPSVSGHGTGILTAGPAIVNYIATDADTVWLCAEFLDDSDFTTHFWDGENDEWSTSSAVPCGLAIGGTDDPSDDPINRIPARCSPSSQRRLLKPCRRRGETAPDRRRTMRSSCTAFPVPAWRSPSRRHCGAARKVCRSTRMA